MSASNFLEDLIVKFAFTALAVTRPTAWFTSTHTADPGDTGASETVVGTDSAYARVSTAFASTGNGLVANSATVTFAAAVVIPASYTVTHFGVWDAATSGNFLGGGQLDTAKVVVDGTILAFGINDLVIEVM